MRISIPCLNQNSGVARMSESDIRGFVIPSIPHIAALMRATLKIAMCPAARAKGNHMTIPFEKLKARLLANPRVKTEYDALAPEFEIAAELREGLRDKGGCSNGAG
jgi:hypothetical protein